ncbi:Mu transposase C-terminal domain-containing protein [Polyangium spumosum]|uniref:Mu transposase C-terminal domain-containing protein n=1 Tax=Polyangium spumosum TaxID=889282 RepID=UPI00147904C5
MIEQRDEVGRSAITEAVRAVCAEVHYLPGHGPIPVSERTVWAWIKRYREGGVEALRPRWRKDKGALRGVDEALLSRATQLRKEQPDRHTKTILDILEREGSLSGKHVPHRATLDRHLDRLGASRRRMRVLGARRTIKMCFERFGELWVGDYHHGPTVLGPDGKPTTAKLGAIIDHSTRYPVADKYYTAEDLATLRDTVQLALLRWGPPEKLYVDRGAVYRSEQLAYSLARIGTKLVHSKEYYSQGRGVIEKWWQVAIPFEQEVAAREELLTIHELNRLWEAWRELRYCEAVHSGLGRAPKEAIAEVTPRPLDPEIVRELFLIRAKRTVHRSDGCVSVEGRRFLCESFLRGREVDVRYDPRDLSHVLVFFEGKRVQRATPQPINATPEPHAEQSTTRVRQSVDYLALLRDDFDRRLLEQAKPLAYAELRVEPGFDGARFVDVVAHLAGLSPRPPQRKELLAFWDSLGPIPESITRIGTEHAVRLHGRGRHVRIYLHAIRTLVLAHLKNPEAKENP